MRYSASEKFEIIELVEQSSLSIPRTLAPIGMMVRLDQLRGSRERMLGRHHIKPNGRIPWHLLNRKHRPLF